MKDIRCNCQKNKNIYEYKYVIVEKLMGFTDYDNYVFEPIYCPFCGIKLIEDNDERD